MSRPAEFRVLWFGQLSSVAGLTVVVPLLPFYLADIGAEPGRIAAWTGIALAAPAAVQVVSGPVWGVLGDRWGRKAMVVRAHAGLALAVGLMALARTPEQFLLCRVLQGACGGVVAATAACAGSITSARRQGTAQSRLFSATALGSLLGPLAGAVLIDRFGFPTLFAGVAVLLAVAALLGVAVLSEPGADTDLSPTGRALLASGRALLRAPSARTLALAGLAAQAAVYGLVVVFAPQVERVTGSVAGAVLWVGVLQAVTWAAAAGGAPWWGRRHDRGSAPRWFALAAAGCAVAALVQALPVPPGWLIPVRVLQGFCFAALIPAVLQWTTSRVGPGNRGGVTGFTTAFLDLGQVVGPLVGALVASLLPLGAVFVAVAAGFALAGGLAWWAHRCRPGPGPDGRPDPRPLTREVHS